MIVINQRWGQDLHPKCPAPKPQSVATCLPTSPCLGPSVLSCFQVEGTAWLLTVGHEMGIWTRGQPWRWEEVGICLKVELIKFFFFNLFTFGCVGSPFPRKGLLQLRQAGATPHCGARAPHYRGLSCCGAQAPDAQAQQLWLTGLVALRHVGSSQTRARTRVPCISRQTLNHCATREAPELIKFIDGLVVGCEKKGA